ncbi:MAG: hypothetical protein Q9227_007751 [Pyrenula ochraceoflavens]
MTTLPIHPKPAPAPLSSETAATITAWTEKTADALHQSTVTSAPADPVRGTRVSLSIPLDDAHRAPAPDESNNDDHPPAPHSTYRRRAEPLRRDSLKRREALLKGKEGSRQRRRWENDRLLNNPHAVPPLPSDWEVHPTHPRHATVPYYLAPLWDEAAYHRSLERKREAAARKPNNNKTTNNESGGDASTPGAARSVPKEIREKLKRARAARGFLQEIEEEVRGFLTQWAEREAERKKVGLGDVPDGTDSEGSGEDEVVFVGRNGVMRDEWRERWKKKTAAAAAAGVGGGREVRRERMVLEGLEGDRGAAFG